MGGSSGSSGAGAVSSGGAGSGGDSGAGGGGGTGGIDCSNVGCGMPPLCSSGCQEPCGCCPCAPGELLGTEYICQGGCFAPRTDGGVSCTVDGDCPAGFFCRVLEAGGMQCAAFAQEGDFCGGFTPAWAEARCAPGFVCTDTPPFLADAPGTCRVPCAGNAQCPTDRYCSATNNVCRDDGACFDDFDCDASANDYPRLRCVGYGDCAGGTCTYQCGSEACRDVAGTSFGYCNAVLGWAVVSGQCSQVSGCDARGHAFFNSQSECVTTCGL
jgi:hypothetical protein